MDNLLASPDVIFNTVYLACVLFIVSTIVKTISELVSIHIRHKKDKRVSELVDVLEKQIVSRIEVPKKKRVIKKSN